MANSSGRSASLAKSESQRLQAVLVCSGVPGPCPSGSMRVPALLRGGRIVADVQARVAATTTPNRERAA